MIYGVLKKTAALNRYTGGGGKEVAGIDVKQFELFIQDYKNIVYALCLSFVRNPYDAEDLAQDTFIAVFRNYSAFDGQNPKSWICTIAANKCRDFLKRPARGIKLADPADFAEVPDRADSVEQLAEMADSAARVDALLLRLREPYRAVAAAYYRDNRTLTEISLETGDNVKTVATRLYRAKSLLKTLWKEDYPNDAEALSSNRCRAE